DVNTDQQNRGLQAALVIDRDTAGRLGIQAQAIDDTLYDAFGQRQVSTIYTALNQYHVGREVAPEFQQNPEALNDIYVKSSTGAQVPLSAITHFAPSTTPLAVNHQGFFPSVTLSFNLAAGIALSDAVTSIQGAERDVGLPASVRASFQGTAQAFQDSLSNQPILSLAALVAVYIALCVLYASTVHPLTLPPTLPAACSSRRPSRSTPPRSSISISSGCGCIFAAHGRWPCPTDRRSSNIDHDDASSCSRPHTAADGEPRAHRLFRRQGGIQAVAAA